MLQKQVWLVGGEFDHIGKNPQRLLGLSAQYENNPYAEEFTKQCSVAFFYGTYVLEGQADAKFSLGEIWNLFQEDHLLSNNFYKLMINCMKTWNYLQKTSGLSLNTEIIKQTHKTMMENEKDVLVGGYRESSAFAGNHIFIPASHIERYMEDAIFKYYATKEDDPIMTAANLFGNIINIHPFGDGNGRICCLILAHVLMQMKCCLFPVAEDITSTRQKTLHKGSKDV